MREADQISRDELVLGFTVCLVDTVFWFCEELLVANVVLFYVRCPLLLRCLIVLLLEGGFNIVAVPASSSVHKSRSFRTTNLLFFPEFLALLQDL